MINKILSKITDNTEEEKLGTITSYLNIYNYNLLRKNPKIVDNIDAFTLDGIMMILFLRFFFGIRLKRKAPDFSSYFTDLFGRIEREGKSISFVGGSIEEIGKFRSIVKQNYPSIKILNTIHGYIDDENKVQDELFKANPDFVVAGMGTPKQESFLVGLKNKGFQGKLFSCGAFISQTASKGKNYFPKLIDKFHLRWAYRIYEDPKLFKRYTIEYPIALFFLLKDYIQKK